MIPTLEELMTARPLAEAAANYQAALLTLAQAEERATVTTRENRVAHTALTVAHDAAAEAANALQISAAARGDDS